MGFLRLAIAVVLFCVQIGAQQKPPTPPPQPPQPPPTQPKPDPAKTSKPPEDPTAERERGLNSDRDVMITGRLVMPDGLSPEEMVPVALSCGPGRTSSTMSDLRGEFRLRLNVQSGPSGDIATRMTNMQCAVIVSVPGFLTVRKDLAGLDLKSGADVGFLVLRSPVKSEGTTVSMNGLMAPEPARQRLLKAREDLAKDKVGSAKSRLEEAIRIYPEYATALYELGRIQARQGNTAQAAESYRLAAKADPKYINPLVELALMSATARDWREAEQHSEAVLRMAPEGFPGMYLVHAIACFNQNKMDAAEKSAREGSSQDKANKFPKLFHLLGNVLLQRGDKQGAVEAFRQYLERAPQNPEAVKVRQQLEALSKQ